MQQQAGVASTDKGRICQSIFDFSSGLFTFDQASVTPIMKTYLQSKSANLAYSLNSLSIPVGIGLNIKGLIYDFRPYFRNGDDVDALSSAILQSNRWSVEVFNPSTFQTHDICVDESIFQNVFLAGVGTGFVPSMARVQGSVPFFMSENDVLDICQLDISLTPSFFGCGKLTLLLTEFDVQPWTRTTFNGVQSA